jgi:hypothetical protein
MGALPIVGVTDTVNSNLVIGSITLGTSGFDPGTNRNLYINSNNVIFSAVTAQVSSAEPVLLKSFAFTQNGSASKFDTSGVQICVIYRSAKNCFDTTIDTDNKYYSADFGDGILVAKGDTVDIYIKGNVGTTGSRRTIDFDVASSYDVSGIGKTYQNTIYGTGGDLDGAQPEGSYSTSEGPFYNAYAHTIVGGSFGSVGK